MIVKRREILKAIRTEKLKGGEGPIEYLPGSTDSDDTCAVCAVGAVLRQKGVDSNDIHMTFCYTIGTCSDSSEDGDEFLELNRRNYMAALSIKFEKLAAHKKVTKKTREILARFVKKHFPKEIKVRTSY